MASPNTSADYFADSSAETVTIAESATVAPYPPPPVIDFCLEASVTSPEANALVDQFLLESNLPARICCPFCTFDFGFEVILKDHIKELHSRELKTLLGRASGQIQFHQCPFCESKFFYKELLPKHVLRKHEMCVVNMFSGFSPEEYVYCRFCPHKTMRKHYKLLMIHIEKKHYSVFENYVLSKYSNTTNSFDDIIDVEKKVESVHYDSSPCIRMDTLKLCAASSDKSHGSPSVKSILKGKTAYPIEKSECLTKNKENAMYTNLTLPQKNPRRKLRFNLQTSPEEKENIPMKKPKLDKKALKLKKSKKQDDLCSGSVNDSDLAMQICHFKCGLCTESFDVNPKLIDHLRKRHKRFTLHAQYRCGECHAKFYRNSYLVRHCWRNHGPLCLKSPNYKKDNSLKF